MQPVRTGEAAARARRCYCGTIGAEFMHIPERERRLWVQERMESEVPEPDRARILDLLIRAEIFEQVLQTRYLGTKRYSLEGEAALLPLLDAILNAASKQGAEKAMVAMSHRLGSREEGSGMGFWLHGRSPVATCKRPGGC